MIDADRSCAPGYIQDGCVGILCFSLRSHFLRSTLRNAAADSGTHVIYYEIPPKYLLGVSRLAARRETFLHVRGVRMLVFQHMSFLGKYFPWTFRALH